MAVANHDDACGAVPGGFNHTRIYYLAVHSVIQSIATEAECDSDREIAIGGDTAGVHNLEIGPRLIKWATTAYHHYAGSESPLSLYQSRIGGLMPVSSP